MPHVPPTTPGDQPTDALTLAHADSVLAASSQFAGRSPGNYDLLEEIGRGGMGVVFKARHRALNRIVALKMILTGQLASADDVRRFRTEAEAAALLDHPNIVPVYEVGEDGGQHFFACKLIEGGALTQEIPRLVEDAKEAARLLVKIARAVDHSHQRGILHRDLKPANILIDAQGEPHVADFGLARRAGDAGQTQSGAILGTPGYMAPEQARAEKGLTTGVDVYSLGAILYECLTGRPPFQADTALEAILRVIEKEPVPPSALNPKVDPELEAVCLKCLAKEPANRYKTASALAEDLESWLAGDPVSARPPSTLGRLRQWLRKDFRAASSTILVGCILGTLFSGISWGWIVRDAEYAGTVYGTFFPSETRPLLSALMGGEPTPSEEAISSWVYAPAPRIGLGAVLAFLALAFGGLLNALVLRPKTRGAALSAGLATGLVTGIVSMLLGSGYGMLANYVMPPVEVEMMLLAEGYRAESLQRQAEKTGRPSSDLEQWDRKVEKKHPDLARPQIPRQERGRGLVEKISIDLRINILVYVWYCFAALGVWQVLPVIFQTMLAQALDARGDRPALSLLYYLEMGLPGTLLLAVGLGYVTNSIAYGGATIAFRLLLLLAWAVMSGLLFDKLIGWGHVVIGCWLVCGLALIVSCLHQVVTTNMSLGDNGQMRIPFILLHCGILVTASAYGIFVKRWRWYVRFAVYLGIVQVAAVVIYFVTR